MTRRTALTFAVVAAILFLVGLHDIIGVLPPNLSVLLVPSIIPAIGVVIAVPLWVAALRASIRRREWWWFTFLIGCILVMPLAVLMYYVAISDTQLQHQ